MSNLQLGLYERLLDEELDSLLKAHPELRPVLRKIDDESAPHLYAQFVGQLFHQALHIEKPLNRLPLVNRVIELLSATNGLDFFERKKLLADERTNSGKNLLLQITANEQLLPRPETPLNTSFLLTGQGADPPLEHELRAEMQTADRVDILISFIKWTGLRLLIPAFEKLKERGVPVRIISTSYMGASDPEAVEWLAQQNNIEVRVSYDSSTTRLHAKAYHFIRKSAFSTAYIGSANMSYSAMTSGLEWTVKATQQDMPHILDRFAAEFASYWESSEFEPYAESEFDRFRKAIKAHHVPLNSGAQFFAEIHPKPFQQRILEALEAARQNGQRRNLIVAATGTGKTVISALDYKRLCDDQGQQLPLLFVAHRKEILEQSLSCFRTVMRDQNFGELLVDGIAPAEWKHVFASVRSLKPKEVSLKHGRAHFRNVIIDEVHHGKANSYRPIFEELDPDLLLGLTATPERMDGKSILADFGGSFAAEIRLPEALEEKLLCPFHYFGVADSIDLSADRFWKNGQYDKRELDNVLTGDDFRAKQRVDLVLDAIKRYHPQIDSTRGVGFCASKKHADYMAKSFAHAGISAATILGDTQRNIRHERLRAFRNGKLNFLFTVDVLSEGVDVPEIDLVMFLRPTESMTVFLQQLGRGLRHSTNKDCLTVLDFVGQTHRKYRLDSKFSALLSRRRKRLDKEIENDFPHLPPGCSIQLERVAKERLLAKIKSSLNDLKNFIPETIKTWKNTSEKPLSFGNFIQETGLSPIQVLSKGTWTEWKARAQVCHEPKDPDLAKGRKALARIALRSDPALLHTLENLPNDLDTISESHGTALHYLLWSNKGSEIGVSSVQESCAKWQENPTLKADAAEIAHWRRTNSQFPIKQCTLPFPCSLSLHAAYGSAEIKAALELSSLNSTGPTGQGVIHDSNHSAYVHLVTFRKDDKDFTPTTRYSDYPISPTQLHWQSQSLISQESPTGQNYLHFKERKYTILFFARLEKKIDGETAPFIFLGSAKRLLSYDGDRPISMVWELEHAMPASLFEEARAL